jgi:hypothetical protein
MELHLAQCEVEVVERHTRTLPPPIRFAAAAHSHLLGRCRSHSDPPFPADPGPLPLTPPCRREWSPKPARTPATPAFPLPRPRPAAARASPPAPIPP